MRDGSEIFYYCYLSPQARHDLWRDGEWWFLDGPEPETRHALQVGLLLVREAGVFFCRPWYVRSEDLCRVTAALCGMVGGRRDATERAMAFSGALSLRARVGDFLADELRGDWQVVFRDIVYSRLVDRVADGSLWHAMDRFASAADDPIAGSFGMVTGSGRNDCCGSTMTVWSLCPRCKIAICDRCARGVDDCRMGRWDADARCRIVI